MLIRFARRGMEASAVFMAADLAPFAAFELGHFFGAVFLVPAAPDEGVCRQIFVRDFLQYEECPVAHLSSGAGVYCQIDELWHQGHALLARENSAVGNIAACAIAHGVGGIFRE